MANEEFTTELDIRAIEEECVLSTDADQENNDRSTENLDKLDPNNITNFDIIKWEQNFENAVLGEFENLPISERALSVKRALQQLDVPGDIITCKAERYRVLELLMEEEERKNGGELLYSDVNDAALLICGGDPTAARDLACDYFQERLIQTGYLQR